MGLLLSTHDDYLRAFVRAGLAPDAVPVPRDVQETARRAITTGLSGVAAARARQLASGRAVSAVARRQIALFLARHDASHPHLDAWGGLAAARWCGVELGEAKKLEHKVGHGWDPLKHPRDAHGRFINVGDKVKLSDGKVGKVMGHDASGHIDVEVGGKRKVVRASSVTKGGEDSPLAKAQHDHVAKHGSKKADGEGGALGRDGSGGSRGSASSPEPAGGVPQPPEGGHTVGTLGDAAAMAKAAGETRYLTKNHSKKQVQISSTPPEGIHWAVDKDGTLHRADGKGGLKEASPKQKEAGEKVLGGWGRTDASKGSGGSSGDSSKPKGGSGAATPPAPKPSPPKAKPDAPAPPSTDAYDKATKKLIDKTPVARKEAVIRQLDDSDLEALDRAIAAEKAANGGKHPPGNAILEDMVKQERFTRKDRARSTGEGEPTVKVGSTEHPQDGVANLQGVDELTDPKKKKAFSDAQKAIAEVHGTTGMRPMDARPTDPVSGTASADYRPSYSLSMNPQIQVRSVDGPGMSFSVAHEIGHGIDWDMGGKTENWASHGSKAAPSEVQAAMKNFIKTARSSVHFKAIAAKRKRVERNTTNDRALVNQHLKFYDYMASDHEVWARAYSQFIATESSDKKMKAELARLQPAHGGVQTLNDSPSFQWDAQDFMAVGDAVRKVLQANGWVDSDK